MDKNDVVTLKDMKEAVGNSETLIERIRTELVVKHGELAREVQRANKAGADVELLEQQVVMVVIF